MVIEREKLTPKTVSLFCPRSFSYKLSTRAISTGPLSHVTVRISCAWCTRCFLPSRTVLSCVTRATLSAVIIQGISRVAISCNVRIKLNDVSQSSYIILYFIVTYSATPRGSYDPSIYTPWGCQVT